MLQVKVTRTVTRPQYQQFASIVTVHGFDRLTPRAARAALEVAFGQPYGGEVWNDNGIGYRVYKNSARKMYDWDAKVSNDERRFEDSMDYDPGVI
jgi:hypothetical protein